MDLDAVLKEIVSESRERFQNKQGVLSFRDYLKLLASKPYTLSRSAPQYLLDLFLHHGCEEVAGLGGRPWRRWRLFDDPSGQGRDAVFGHEAVQERLFEIFSEFVKRGVADKFILLHGPNGSAKSSIFEAMVSGLEHYSHEDAGALFRFSWIFCEDAERGRVGFAPAAALDELGSFAHVDERLISSRLPCEMKDPPFFLLPRRHRRAFFERSLENAAPGERDAFHFTSFILKGNLSPKNKKILDCLLKSYDGDLWRVFRHVRVERYEISHRYHTGAVTIEPQATIDAGARLLAHPSSSGLPPVLAHENIVEATGDLVDANGGIVEYSDFLKRNPEANKYLLTTAEQGFVNLPSVSVALNLVLIGSTNEKYLAAFKRDPSFPSFKGRFELVRVPYLRDYTKEALIYTRYLEKVRGEVDVAPHTAELAALWAVLTRLRVPDPRHFEGDMRDIVKRLGPMEKALLYAQGSLPGWLTYEQAKILSGQIQDLRDEWSQMEEEFEGLLDAAYEGRRGASPREVMTLLTELVVERDRRSLSPVDLFEALHELVAQKSLYSFLRQNEERGYHDFKGFIEIVKREYVFRISREIQKASDLVEEGEYERLFREYMRHVRAGETHEKVLNRQTGQGEDPDESFMKDVEQRLGVAREQREFRRQLMSKAAAWRISNKDLPLVLEELFREHYEALEKSFFKERQERILGLVDDVLLMMSGSGDELSPDRLKNGQHLCERLQRDFGYGQETLGAMFSYFQKHHDLLA